MSPDDEVTALIAGVLNDRRTPTDSRGRARTIRDVLAAARMLATNAYPTADQISLFDMPSHIAATDYCERDSECVLHVGHFGGCMDQDELDEWQAH